MLAACRLAYDACGPSRQGRTLDTEDEASIHDELSWLNMLNRTEKNSVVLSY